MTLQNNIQFANNQSSNRDAHGEGSRITHAVPAEMAASTFFERI